VAFIFLEHLRILCCHVPTYLATVAHWRNMNHPAPSITALTRRNLISGAALALVGIRPNSLFAGSQQAAPSSSSNATRTSLHQEIDLKATPARIYSVLLDSKQFTAFSHEPADIHGEPGGAFSMFGARILGRNVELVPNQRIVQAWRSAGWDLGTYSIVRFDFKEQGTQPRVVLNHTGFPAGAYDSLYSGWKSHYWDPLQLFFP
jgi:activator of HSP90 ATPase